jgi:hypothetical protein
LDVSNELEVKKAEIIKTADAAKETADAVKETADAQEFMDNY